MKTKQNKNQNPIQKNQWVYRKTREEILLCSCGNKYIKTREKQTVCVTCIYKMEDMKRLPPSIEKKLRK